MTKLEQLYNSIQNLKELGVQLPDKLIEETNRVEKEIIESEVIPTLSEAIEPIINQIKRELVLVVEYIPEEPLSVKLTRKRSLTIPPEQEYRFSDHSKKDYKEKESYSLSPHSKSSRTALRVTFSDGTSISYKYAYLTLLKVIERAGYINVRELGIKCCGVPLVSDTWDDFYRQHELKKDVLVMTHSSTEVKKQQIEEISRRLGLGLVVEVV